MKTKLKLISILSVVFFLFQFLSFAQNANLSKFRLAESYLKIADYQSATPIFKELYAAEPKNESYFYGLVKCLKSTNKFKELHPILQERVDRAPNEITLNLLAEINWRLGKANDANLYWEKTLTTYNKNEKVYLLVSETQSELQLFDKAINTLLKARETSSDKMLFSDQLSKLYIVTGNYKDGSNEIMNILFSTNNIATAQGRFYALQTSPEAKQYIKSFLKSKTDQFSMNLLVLELYAWYLRSINDFDSSLDIYKKLDKLKNSAGYEVYMFGENARKDGQFDIAIKAYESLIDEGKNSRYFTNALFGLANTLEEKIATNQKFDIKSIDEIINRYKAIIKDFPNSPITADCMLRLGKLQFNVKKDFESAIKSFSELTKKYSNSIQAADASYNLGQIYTINGDFDKAITTFLQTDGMYQGIAPNYADLARFSLAKILYYQGKIDSAKTIFTELSKNSNSNTANDCLNLLNEIEKGNSDKDGLAKFAQYEYKMLQNNFNDARKILSELIARNIESDVSERSVLEIAKLYDMQNDTTNSIEVLKNFYAKNILSIYLDKIILLLGDYTGKLNHKEEALSYYNQFLIKFPESIYIQEVRDKIRKLRQDF